MKAVDILVNTDRAENAGLIEMSGQWKLYENTIDVCGIVPFVNFGHDLSLRDVVGKMREMRLEANTLCCFLFVRHIAH